MVEINEQSKTNVGEGSMSRDVEEVNNESIVLTDHQEQSGMFSFKFFLIQSKFYNCFFFLNPCIHGFDILAILD